MASLGHIPPRRVARLENASERGKLTKVWRSVSKQHSPGMYVSGTQGKKREKGEEGGRNLWLRTLVI